MLMCSNRTCIFMQCILYHPSYQQREAPNNGVVTPEQVPNE